MNFDQPLFLKVMDIVAGSEESSNLSKIIVRLGGFHLLMVGPQWNTCLPVTPLLELWGLTYWHMLLLLPDEVRCECFYNEFLVVYGKLINNEVSQKSACDENSVKLSMEKFTDHINTIKL